MSFVSGSENKTSLFKIILITTVLILVIGGLYTFFGGKKSEDADKASEDKVVEAKVNPSGLDKDKSVDNVEDVEQVVAKWIAANPMAIIDSVNGMQKKAMEEQTQNAQKNISSKLKELFEDENSPSYSKSSDYDVTIVEFFDYACGYCKKAQTTVEKLLQSDQKIRIIYKELPILGSASTELSTVSIAVNLTDSSHYKKFHDALMKSSAKSKKEAIRIAKSVGVNVSKLESTLKNKEEQIKQILEANLSLGGTIGVNGTPGFIIGEELVPGAVDLSSFEEKIAKVRSEKK